MKYGIGLVAIILIGLIGWYVYTNNQPSDLPDTTDKVSSEKSSEQPNSENLSNSNPNTESKKAESGSFPTKVEKKNPDGSVSESAGDDESSEEDYGEPVSKEDFKDFITTALDELAEDETTALAIVREMDKISRAQPAHEDEVVRFYRECSKRPKVSPKVQEACAQALHDKGM